MNNEKRKFDLDDEKAEERDESTEERHESPEEMAAREPVFKTSDSETDYATSERFQKDQDELVDFFKYPRNKQNITKFFDESYKGLEQEAVERAINRAIYEHKSELEGATPYHKPGHIGPLLYEFLNMCGVEEAYCSGLQHTKSSMTKTVQQRVDEINTLLRGVGGFNRQIKASFSRSAVVYLEQEDPRNTHRERVIFTINLSDNELKFPLDSDSDQQVTEDGRSARRFGWDEAVNTLAEIISATGMKPKYVKNDKNSLVFNMSQYLLGEDDPSPDEYFSFEMRYVDEEARQKLVQEYAAKIGEFDKKIAKLRKKSKSVLTGHKAKEFFDEQASLLEFDKDFYIGTTPDPREMDPGIVFSIQANTMKDYNITKDKMQVIMTKFILALSKIAVDKSMDEQLNTDYGKTSAEAAESLSSSRRDLKSKAKMKKRVVLSEDVKKWKAG